ncbi:Lacticin 481/lactococcin biosynthesis protein lcnDR2 [Paenibacillus nuruki]|uniref:Lacticin 481/lactococcin biosynthesis protein lcnDR2 n=1 Tax=Paenibacillus nuruki TaxID=1886670 RepID=A0A1E3L3J7_9BACL|nr:type 2 lanthipeptide synthetase LanM family protein [Paenibacillus nuruki]ODP28223.1 Lacticin 481/lactococcin biosynthesis protein lcnDR2 [Paenibacillus nuruki]
MTLLDICKLKTATYLQERMITEPISTVSITNEALEQWTEYIQLPVQYRHAFLESYSKSEQEFNSLTHPLAPDIVLEDQQKWIDDLQQLMSDFNANESILYAVKGHIPTEHPYLCFTYPFLYWMQQMIDMDLPQTPKVDQQAIQSVILEATLQTVLKLSVKVLTVEINKLSKHSLLKGDTPEARYQDFCTQLQQRQYFTQLVYEYPTMFRMIIEESIQQKNFLLEAVDHLMSDFNQIQAEFGLLGALTGIEMNKGDSHCGKKTVLICAFEHGKVVYKPKPLQVNNHVNQIIEYMNNHGLEYPIKPLPVIAYEDYGWQVYIEQVSSTSEAEIEELYYKVGAYLCLLHVLMGSDMHTENVIMSGNNPYFVDLESLFQGYDSQDLQEETAYKKVLYAIKDSVIRTCLFPAKLDKQSNLDISGLTGTGEKTIAKGKFTFEHNYTDQIKLVRTRYTTTHKKNIPLLHGVRVDPRQYVTSIVKGFEQAYQIICQNKFDFIGQHGLIRNFAKDKVRTIVRNTSDYSTLLNASTNPNYLIDALYRNRLFDRMWAISSRNHRLLPIIPAEIYDLLHMDIPYFYSYVDHTSIYDSRDLEYEYFHQETLLDRVILRIENMDEQHTDQSFQVQMIKTALATPIKKWDLKQYKKDYRETDHLERKPAYYFIKEATRIADELIALSTTTTDFDDISWQNVTIGNDEQWIINPLDNSLYEGLLGNAIFFAMMYQVTEQTRYLDVVEKILVAVNLDTMLYNKPQSLSAFTGEASYAYSYYYLGMLLERQELKDQGIQHILHCGTKIAEDDQYDLMAGCAGTLLVALQIYQDCLKDEVLSIAIQCGEHLIKHATQVNDYSIGWQNAIGDGSVLTGMSHGNAGIAWALAELYEETRIETFRNYSNQAIAYERGLYSIEENNWFDLRNRQHRIQKNFPEPVNWCHGAPGIGMARVKIFNIIAEQQTGIEIKRAIQKTLQEGFGGSDCLCHGSMGNIDLLLLSAQHLGQSEHLDIAQRIVGDLVKNAQADQWYSGIPQTAQVPTLMIGLAGIGYQLLRTIDPYHIPSVLTLELPHQSQV